MKALYSEKDLMTLYEGGMIDEAAIDAIIKAGQGVPLGVWLPMMKAQLQNDDTIIHHGIASDESLDLEGDRLRQEVVARSLPYLEQWGTFNWMHRDEDIGNVLEARQMRPPEVERVLGREVAERIEGTATYLKGTIYPIVDPALASEDLKVARHRILAGARLGYSLHGTMVRTAQGVEAVFANAAAIAPQPINTNAVVKLAKSLTEAAEHIIAREEAGGSEAVQVVYPLRPLLGADGEAELRKMLEAGEGVNAALFQGGRALQEEELEGRVQRVCHSCGRVFTPRARRQRLCKRCRREQRRIVKSLLGTL